jgi:hypothetical protein
MLLDECQQVATRIADPTMLLRLAVLKARLDVAQAPAGIQLDMAASPVLGGIALVAIRGLLAAGRSLSVKVQHIEVDLPMTVDAQRVGELVKDISILCQGELQAGRKNIEVRQELLAWLCVYVP